MFGHSFKEKHFPASDKGFTPVNHGSYGLPPQCVIDKYMEAFYGDVESPDTFFRITQAQEYKAGIEALGKFLNCPYKSLALVTNATTAVNSVLRSFPFKKGDKIALPNTTYGACYNTVKFLEKSVGIVPVLVELDFPMSDSQVVAKFDEAFQKNDIKMALYDSVVSMPGVKLPFVEITQLCKKYGIVSLVDGAHSIGLIPVDLGTPDFQPDFFTTNVHKWLSTPRGCAVLYVAPKYHETVQTMPISHSYSIADEYRDEKGAILPGVAEDLLVSKFTFIGSNILAAFATIPAAIKFREEVCGGEEKIRTYCEGLAREVGKLTLEQWPGTKLLENEERSLITAMVTLTVPIEQYSSTFDARNRREMAKLIEFVSVYMVKEYRTFVPFAAHNDKVVVRFSAQIYNDIADFEYAIEAAKHAVQAYFKRENKL